MAFVTQFTSEHYFCSWLVLFVYDRFVGLYHAHCSPAMHIAQARPMMPCISLVKVTLHWALAHGSTRMRVYVTFELCVHTVVYTYVPSTVSRRFGAETKIVMILIITFSINDKYVGSMTTGKSACRALSIRIGSYLY